MVINKNVHVTGESPSTVREPMCRWVEADRVDHESAWDLYQVLSLLATISGATMAITDATKVCEVYAMRIHSKAVSVYWTALVSVA